ncbi:MAG TPA: RNA polymerase factor sigma-54 [Burkholderiales bacterium]|jgi:RNA polymerase sigma-54 factor|nr:RNA polymerase factor sigma-54 [Burkholderiales bacterium]
MKHSLQLKLSQHLTLTPQLQQSIRLLQLSTLELNQEIERFLQENPLLEREEEEEEGSGPLSPSQPLSAPTAQTAADSPAESVADSPAEAEWSIEDGYSGYAGSDADDDGESPQLGAGATTLRDHLLEQLVLMQLSERDKRIVAFLIDNLDDDGFMKQDLAELAAILPEELEIDSEQLAIALKYLQHLEPAGIGARSLSECLALQLEAMPADTPYRAEALKVVREHLDALASRDYQKLKKLLKCDDDTLRGIQNLVTSLNPRPAANYSGNEARYIIPDVVVRKVKGLWVASLNPDAMPKLRINRLYADILHRNRDASFQQLAGQLQEAKWLIKNVQQRFDTILRVSQAIVDRQRHFFEHGEVAMRPLVLREIAETLGLHESTVSRVTTQKFMLTPRGIFELKYFFGSHVATETGGACSATAIRALIKQLVGEEDRRNPLSDSQISEILGKQGIMVARRTIAKYRESLQILPVNLRKTI